MTNDQDQFAVTYVLGLASYAIDGQVMQHNLYDTRFIIFEHIAQMYHEFCVNLPVQVLFF